MVRRNFVTRMFVYFMLVVLIVICIYPLIWMIISSFKTNGEFLLNKFGLPQKITFENYTEAWNRSNFPLYFANSGVTSVMALFVMIIFAAMTSYAFTRYHKPIVDKLLTYFTVGQLLSAQVMLIAVYLVAITLRLADSKIGLALVYAASGLPFTILLLNGYFKTVPSELYEAAEVDGYNEWRIFWTIAITLVGTGLSTGVIIQFMYVWNEFPLGLILISSKEKTTLPVGIYRVVNDMYYSSHTLSCAGLSIAALPVILVYAIFQRQFISGMTTGAVKG